MLKTPSGDKTSAWYHPVKLIWPPRVWIKINKTPCWSKIVQWLIRLSVLTLNIMLRRVVADFLCVAFTWLPCITTIHVHTTIHWRQTCAVMPLYNYYWFLLVVWAEVTVMFPLCCLQLTACVLYFSSSGQRLFGMEMDHTECFLSMSRHITLTSTVALLVAIVGVTLFFSYASKIFWSCSSNVLFNFFVTFGIY
jgi:uncharacterized membrane protein YdcZ (DUF606 family)